MTEADLSRFMNAQAQVYSRAVEELTQGRSGPIGCGSFSEVAGLGTSTMAQRYAIRDLDQARRYLADPLLGSWLRQVVRLMMDHKGKSALEILGFTDDLKFRSCLTLFRQAASKEFDRVLFTEALDQFYRGEPDHRTLELLR